MIKLWTGLIAGLFVLMAATQPLRAQEKLLPAPERTEDGIYTQPWFIDSFLDLAEDMSDAAKAGKQLVINYTTGAKGSVRVAITDAAGKPLSGFSSGECQTLQGDKTAQTVSWKGAEAGKLAGKSVQLVFELNDADVYSFQFAE